MTSLTILIKPFMKLLKILKNDKARNKSNKHCPCCTDKVLASYPLPGTLTLVPLVKFIASKKGTGTRGQSIKLALSLCKVATVSILFRKYWFCIAIPHYRVSNKRV
ncbi:hypothetical protein ACF0H5_005245 [Mactra antiquata]